MKIRIRLVAAVFLILGFAFAGSAFARPQYCEQVCTPDMPDDIVCSCERIVLPFTTCGGWRDNFCGLMMFPSADQPLSQLGESTQATCDTLEAQTEAEAAHAGDAMCWAAPERA